MRNFRTVWAASMLIVVLTACSVIPTATAPANPAQGSTSSDSSTVTTPTSESVADALAENQKSHVSADDYTYYTGGSAAGTLTDGLYQAGTYTPGSQVSSFNVNDTVTTVGSGGRMGPGGGGPGSRP